jgi:hypothetical protein
MATTTSRNQTRTRSEAIMEFVAGAAPQRVDAEQGIIYGVKILGLESPNGRTYTDAARVPLALSVPILHRGHALA